jgi:hypothetical protein
MLGDEQLLIQNARDFIFFDEGMQIMLEMIFIVLM